MSRYAIGGWTPSRPTPAVPRERSPWPAPPANGPLYLHPGQLHADREPCVVSTILGSCVAVCLFDAAAGVGGVNHFLLPHESGDEAPVGRYGPAATRALIARVLALGASRESLAARIVGGANVLAAFHRQTRHLGTANVEAAREVLRAAGVRVVAEEVGGTSGRKLLFSFGDGAAWVQSLGTGPGTRDRTAEGA